MTDLFKFKTVDQLHGLIKEINCLRELVKCPVCIEVTKNPVRTACDHIFCANCVETLIHISPNWIPKCPICRKTLGRQWVPLNGYVESLLVFLSSVDVSMETMFASDILALSNKKYIDKIFKQKVSGNSLNKATAKADCQDYPLRKTKYGSRILKRYGLDEEYSNNREEISGSTKNDNASITKQKKTVKVKEHIKNYIEGSEKLEESDDVDFICNSLTTNKHKLSGYSMFSKAQSITQSSKDSNYNSRISNIQITKSKHLNDAINKSKALTVNISKPATTVACTQTVFIQTAKEKISYKTDNKEFCSFGTQTECFTCGVCKNNNMTFQSNRNGDLTFSKIEGDDLELKTRKVTERNVTTVKRFTFSSQRVNRQQKDEKIDKLNTSVSNDEETIIEQYTKPKLNTNAGEFLSISNEELCEKKIAEVPKRYKRIKSLDVSSDESSVEEMKLGSERSVDLSIEIISENIADYNDLDDVVCANKPTSKECSQDQPLTSKRSKSHLVSDKNSITTNFNLSGKRKRYNEAEENIQNVSATDFLIDSEVMQEFDESLDQKLFQSINDTSPSTETFMTNIDINELENSGCELTNDLSSLDSVTKGSGTKNVQPKKRSNVFVLRNIQLNTKYLTDQKDNGGDVQSDDLFGSESSEVMDEDIVETTPLDLTWQSQVIHRVSSPQLIPTFEKGPIDIVPSTDSVFFLNQTFTPPVDFQDRNNDDNDDSDNFGVTLTTLDIANKQLNDIKVKNNVTNNDNNNKNVDTIKNILQKLTDTDTDGNFITQNDENFEVAEMSSIHMEERGNPTQIAQGRKLSNATTQSSIEANNIDNTENTVTLRPSEQSPSLKTKPYISCTRLNKDQMLSISTLSSRKLMHYTSTFSPHVTHMIVAVNKNNCLLNHTIKVLLAIAYGKWVVSTKWINDCLLQNRILPEEAYEALDVSGFPGPRTSRLKGKEKLLLKGYRIRLEPPFSSATKKDIEELIRVLGGEIVVNVGSLLRREGIRLIIADAHPMRDYRKYEEWLKTYKVMVVDIEWLTCSIAQYQVISLDRFALCSDDNIKNLGYPPELTAETSVGCSDGGWAINSD